MFSTTSISIEVLLTSTTCTSRVVLINIIFKFIILSSTQPQVLTVVLSRSSTSSTT